MKREHGNIFKRDKVAGVPEQAADRAFSKEQGEIGPDDMIVFEDVSKNYVIGDNVVHALSHANMRIRKGEFVSIIGPSGSGKSTLMNIVGCLDQASSGTYFLDGMPIEEYSKKELTRIRNNKIGFIFQDFNLLPRLTAYENVELPLIYQRQPADIRKMRVEEALTRVGLLERRDHKPTELSGGQQQRVAIARALATHPDLFLADEPTGNLDQKTGRELMDLFHEMNAAGATIVLITHDAHVAAQATRSIKILDGHVEDLTDMDELASIV
ncbi:MAG: ABC transporter ATP-binding protein [Lachnospiraceae bacterium]|nr:ABC transporter ATP-binding protein [Lachnospiraceae bacterium]